MGFPHRHRLVTVLDSASATPAPPAFTPASLAGLAFWYDASQITGLSNGDPLSTFPDLSGFGRDLIATVVPARYETAMQNGLPVVRFWPTAPTPMTTAAPFSWAANKAFFFACHTLFSQPQQEILNHWGGAATADTVFCEDATASSNATVLNSASTGFSGIGGELFTVPHYGACIIDPSGTATIRYDLDGVAGTPVALTGAFAAGNYQLSMGARTGGSVPWLGHIFEVFGCDGIPSGAVQTQIATYLSTKWGL